MPRSFIKRIATIAASLALAYSAGASAAASHPAFKVQVTGQGAPVILIPGLASSGEVWDGTVAHYCGSRQCHVVTLAGFAGVPAIEGPLLPAVEQQLSDYIAANKFDHPIIIGHSLGGFVGMKLAADHPDQVGRLVIVDTLPALAAVQMPSITGAQMKEMAAGLRTRMESMDAEAKRANQMKTLQSMITKQEDIDRAAAWGKQSDPATVTNAMVEMMSEDMRAEVGRIKAPTLVRGSWIAYKDYGSKPMFEQMYTSQYQQLPNVKVELADNARHFIMYDDPAWMYDRIDNFLK
ncbi:alpha/beta hydrolase [Duganella sp. BJB488]|uniref:alpha/beta fold hydrolase n=1 Tax=unclassified Duganella TaxID=2636909 RepID=UPI000E34272A|nr:MULTISPECIES: alpha/beta hydrolase [unclassified Duganella]RFP12338.1 alpha/beta hydrolase [Duganella sp. BJB489]RFP16568.1 alpha/beta hydrolase [Duganella sp. BJB488]RFP30702.1 alpha/beta hydrolase [Duganella sp. BJB480]